MSGYLCSKDLIIISFKSRVFAFHGVVRDIIIKHECNLDRVS